MSSKYEQALNKAKRILATQENQLNAVVSLQRISKKKWLHTSTNQTYKEQDLIQELDREVPGRIVILFDATSLPISTLTPSTTEPEAVKSVRNKKETIQDWNEPEIDESDSWKL